jgi:hypothetical protein
MTLVRNEERRPRKAVLHGQIKRHRFLRATASYCQPKTAQLDTEADSFGRSSGTLNEVAI